MDAQGDVGDTSDHHGSIGSSADVDQPGTGQIGRVAVKKKGMQYVQNLQ